uniref:Uncharacterized protein n=1 Tax=Kalanchoe fedtschenkoi TaxID=63787 RepID=A0A7N0TWK6_KALFE
MTRIQLGQPATVKAAANLVRLLSYNNKNMLQTGMIVGGWDKYEGGKIYGVPLGGTLIEQPFAIGGMCCRNLTLPTKILQPIQLKLFSAITNPHPV